MIKLTKLSFYRHLKAPLIVIMLSLLIFSPVGGAEARVAFTHRNDINIVDEITVVLHAQIQSYIKYVVTALDELEAIKDIKNLVKDFDDLQEIIELKDTVGSLLSEAEGLQDSLESMLGDISFEDMSAIKDILNGSGMDSIDFSQIESGSKTDGRFRGISGSIIKIRDSKGASEAAGAALDRSNQLIEELPKSMAEKIAGVSAGDTKEVVQALVNAHTYIYKSVPFADPVYSKYFSDLSAVDAPQRVDIKIMRIHTASGAKAAPAGTIIEIADKYLSPNSPFSEEKMRETFSKEMTLQIEKSTEKGNGSAVEETTRQAGVLLRQRNMMIRQMAVLAEMRSDLVRLGALNASMKACISSMSLENAIGEYINAYTQGAQSASDEDGGKSDETKD